MYNELLTDAQLEFIKTVASSDYNEDGDQSPHTEYEAPTLETLLTQYSAEQIMATNDGKIPSTGEEVKTVAKVLAEKEEEGE